MENFRISTNDQYIIEYILSQIQIDLNVDNMLMVSKNGNDLVGARNGPPFLTVTKALQAAQNYDTVLVLPGIYNESISLQNINLVGMGDNVYISLNNVTENTTLCTISDNTRVSGINFSLTSSIHVNLIGLFFTGGSTQTSFIKNSNVYIDNSSASSSGTSNVFGIQYSCTTQGDIFSLPIKYSISMCDVNVKSSGFGEKRGVLVTGDDVFGARYMTAMCNSPHNSGNNYFGLEVDSPCFMYILDSQINGTTGKASPTTLSLLHISSTLDGSVSYVIKTPVQGVTPIYQNITNQRCFITFASFTQFTFAAVSGELHLITPNSDALVAFVTASTDSGGNSAVPRSQAVYCNSTSVFGFGAVIMNPGDILQINIIGDPTGMTGILFITVTPDVNLLPLFVA